MSSIQKNYLTYTLISNTEFTRTPTETKNKTAQQTLNTIIAILDEKRSLKSNDMTISLIYQGALRQILDDTAVIVENFEEKYFKWVIFDCLKNFLKKRKWSKIYKVYDQQSAIERRINNLIKTNEAECENIKKRCNNKRDVAIRFEQKLAIEKTNLNKETEKLTSLKEELELETSNLEELEKGKSEVEEDPTKIKTKIFKTTSGTKELLKRQKTALNNVVETALSQGQGKKEALEKNIARQTLLVAKWAEQVRKRELHVKQIKLSHNQDIDIYKLYQMDFEDLEKSKLKTELVVDLTAEPQINLSDLPAVTLPKKENSNSPSTSKVHKTSQKSKTPEQSKQITAMQQNNLLTQTAETIQPSTTKVVNGREAFIQEIKKLAVSDSLKTMLELLVSENSVASAIIKDKHFSVTLTKPVGRCTQILKADKSIEVKGGAILTLGLNEKKEFAFEIKIDGGKEIIEFKEGFTVWSTVKIAGLKQYRVFKIINDTTNKETQILNGYTKAEKPFWLMEWLINSVKKVINMEMGFNENGDFVATRVKKTEDLIELWQNGGSILFDDSKKYETKVKEIIEARKSQGL